MVSSRKRKQSNRNLFSQLDDFDRNIIIGNTVSNRQENATVNEDIGDQKFFVDNPDTNLVANKILVNVKSLETCFNEQIDKENINIIDSVEERIQMLTSTGIDSNITPRVEISS